MHHPGKGCDHFRIQLLQTFDQVLHIAGRAIHLFRQFDREVSSVHAMVDKRHPCGARLHDGAAEETLRHGGHGQKRDGDATSALSKNRHFVLVPGKMGDIVAYPAERENLVFHA